MTLHVEPFFDPATYTLTYLVICPETGHAAIIDSVLDYDASSGRTKTSNADALIAYVRAQDLTVDWLLETHAHADHLSAAPYLQDALGGKIGIGADIPIVQKTFAEIFHFERSFSADGRQFDHLFAEGERFAIGRLTGTAWHTPGHTPACVSYLVGAGDQIDCAFIGDTLFMPDYGTARCDFPGGDAATLYKSVQRILDLPDQTKLYTCHDYLPGGREMKCMATVAEHRAANVHVKQGIAEADFVKMRSERDAELGMPALILPSVQVNIRAGHMPPAEENGVHYLKIPLNAL